MLHQKTNNHFIEITFSYTSEFNYIVECRLHKTMQHKHLNWRLYGSVSFINIFEYLINR